MYELIVNYDGFKTNLDNKIKAIADNYGGIESGSGYGPEGRDLVFEFKNLDQAEQAKQKLNQEYVKVNTIIKEAN